MTTRSADQQGDPHEDKRSPRSTDCHGWCWPGPGRKPRNHDPTHPAASPLNARLIQASALLAALWALLAIWEADSRPWSGYTASHRNIVISVRAGSPAEAAGVLPGDRIIAINEHATAGPGALRALGRGVIGELRLLRVQRADRVLDLRLSYQQLPLSDRIRAWLRIATGLAYLGIGYFAWRRSDTRMTRLLAVACTGFALAFLPGPWLGPDGLRTLLAVVRSALVLAAMVALLRFVALLPPGQVITLSGAGRLLVIAPAAFLWVLLSARAVADGVIPGTLVLIAVGLVLSGYLLSATVLFLRKYIRTEGGDRDRLGLRAMLWCSLAGTLPGLLGGFTLLGRWPFAAYLFVTAILAPLSWAAVAHRIDQSRSA